MNYFNPDYDRYFEKEYIDEYVTPQRTIKRVLDLPDKVMSVKIDFAN